MDRYKILWIDDEARSYDNESFLTQLERAGFDVETAICFDEGVEMIEDSSIFWDAIIWDVNSKISIDDAYEGIDSFTEAMAYIRSYCDNKRFIPWFVLTAGVDEDFSSLKSRIPKNRNWDDRPYYLKTDKDKKALIQNLKKASNEQPSTQVKLKYADTINAFDCMQNELIHILMAVESGIVDKSTYLNEIRNTLMKIRDVFISVGIASESLNIKDISRHLGKCSNADVLVPSYIQLSLYSCIEITNSGSHGELPAASDTNDGKAPYLLRSTAFALLNIVVWLKQITQNPVAINELVDYLKKYIPSSRVAVSNSNIVSGQVTNFTDTGLAYVKPNGSNNSKENCCVGSTLWLQKDDELTIEFEERTMKNGNTIRVATKILEHKPKIDE